MDLYRLQIPLDSYDIITGSTVISGVTHETGYVWLTKTGDTFVNLFLTSDYDDIGIYTDFADRDIFEMITTIPTGSGNTQYVAVAPPCVNCSTHYVNPSDLPSDTFYIHPDGTVFYNFSAPISSFNFEVVFCNCGNDPDVVANGGDVADTQMTVLVESGQVGIRVMAGSVGYIPAGSGILTNLTIGDGCKVKGAINYSFQGVTGAGHTVTYITDYPIDTLCDPCCTHDGTVEYVAVETTEEEPCVGEIININMFGDGEFDLLTIDPGGEYETNFYSPGGTMCLPFGCYDVRYASSSGGIFNIKDEYGNLIPIDGAPRDDSEGATFAGENLIEGNFCIKCKTGKLAIATYQSSGYTGATAYVMATSQCLTWTVTGTTSNNIMEIYPIAGLSQLSTSVHAKYDANENPIEVTLIYGNPTSGADYDIGSGSTIISYSTPDVNNVNSSFNFERECCEECYGLNTKEEMKMGWVFDPKINVNVFIDRGQNSVFDKFLRLSEVNNNDELLDYDNNYFKVNKEQI